MALLWLLHCCAAGIYHWQGVTGTEDTRFIYYWEVSPCRKQGIAWRYIAMMAMSQARMHLWPRRSCEVNTHTHTKTHMTTLATRPCDFLPFLSISKDLHSRIRLLPDLEYCFPTRHSHRTLIRAFGPISAHRNLIWV